MDFPGAFRHKNLPAVQETWAQSLVGKIPWRRKWEPSPEFLPERFQGQRSLAGYSLWGLRLGHDLVTEHAMLWSVSLQCLL